jgi:RNA polymerase sigma-70 factor (ECF subfamily)
MGHRYGDTTQLQACLDRWREGDVLAREDLFRQSRRRLRQLASNMLNRFPTVRCHEETDDVLQSALIRLDRALVDVHPTSVAHYISLSALQIRRQLMALARYYARQPRRIDKGHQVGCSSDDRPSSADPPDPTSGPATLAEWTEFHRLVEQLAPAERQIFDLHFYEGLSLADTAAQLGVSERTIKRRWQSARISLHKALHGVEPLKAASQVS